MRRIALLVAAALLLAACVTVPPAPQALPAWPERLRQLQSMPQWDLQGRAAAAVGTQGWQANLSWHQGGQDSEIHLAGPLGVGAMALNPNEQGVEINGRDAAAIRDAAAYLAQRLGFTPPFARLRYWLLGVPSPELPFEWQGNAQDRALSIQQDGWRSEYPDYIRVGADLLPRRMTLTRDTVRVRVAVDRWTLPP